MCAQRILLGLVISIAVFLSSPSFAQFSEVSNILVSADTFVQDLENNRLNLRDNVQVIFQNQHLYCERATVDLKKKVLIATGKVSLMSPTMTVDGERVELNYETNLGTIYNGFVRSGAVTFEGDVIHKTGDNEFEVENGYYTACKSCPAAWAFTGKKIRAEVGGYAYITQPVFRLADYPFFWLPYLIVPLKSKRQTGFLFPSFDYSAQGGTAIGQSFFWAVNDHKDFTFTLKNYANRGLKGLMNHRFFMDTNSYGELDLAIINDKVLPSDDRIFGLSDEDAIERWFLKYEHYYNLPGGYVHRTKLNLVSDLKYTIDFPDEIDTDGDPALENRMSLTKNTDNWHSHIEVGYYINQLKTDIKENNDDAVHRFPEIQVDLIEKEIARSGLLLSLHGKYTNFSRNSFDYDDILFDPNDADGVTKRFNEVRDGEFNFDGTTSQDQIRTGQRLTVQPKLSYPMKVGDYVDILPSLSYNQSLYQFGVGDDQSISRSYLRTNVSARTSLSRVYQDDDEDLTRYKHEIVPEIGLTYIPVSEFPSHPFFGTSDELANFRSDLPVSDEDFFGDSGLQFDYYDRILDRKLISLGVTNKLIEKRNIGGVASYHQVGLFRLTQNYDLIEAESSDADRQPFSDLEALLDLRFRNFRTNSTINYFPYHRVTNINSRVRLISDVGNFVQLTYTKRFIVGDELDVDEDTRSENLNFAAGYISKYFNIVGSTRFSLVTHELLSWSYQVDLKPPGDCWGIIFRHTQNQGGEPSFKINFAYSFDGKKTVALGDQLY